MQIKTDAQEIATDIREYLLAMIRSAVKSETAVNDYFYRHVRVCLTNEDMSGEQHWYRVNSREEVLAIKQSFNVPEAAYEKEPAQIIDAIIAGYNIDFSKPTWMGYDLNRLVPILAEAAGV